MATWAVEVQRLTTETVWVDAKSSEQAALDAVERSALQHDADEFRVLEVIARNEVDAPPVSSLDEIFGRGMD